jgi:hypothetical protein
MDLEFGEERLDVVDALLDMLGARHRQHQDGSFEVLPVTPGRRVWEVSPGDGGDLVSWSLVLSDEGLVNRVVSRGTGWDGGPLVGRADATAGSWLDPAGPLGVMPLFHTSTANTQHGVTQDARDRLAQEIAASTVDVELLCLINPALQVWDRVRVVLPVAAGRLGHVDGDVVGLALASTSGRGGTTPAKSMELTVRVARDDLERLGRTR